MADLTSNHPHPNHTGVTPMQISIDELYRVCPADSRALDTDDDMLFSEREAQSQAAARNLRKHDGCANWKAQRLSDAR